jgi:hypothetical protein
MTSDITPHRMIELFAIIRACDYKFREPGKEDVQVWCGFAADGGWSAEVVGRIIRAHYRTPGAEAIRPGDVEAAYRELRRKAMVSFEDPVLPKELPAGMTYPEWLRERQAEHRDAALAQWAATGIEPKPVPPKPLGSGRDVFAEIVAHAPDEQRREIAAAAARMVGRRIPRGDVVDGEIVEGR